MDMEITSTPMLAKAAIARMSNPDFDAFMEEWKEGIEAMHNRFASTVIKACWACGENADCTCCCGNPICERHSFDTFGQHAKFGICSDCVEQLHYHYGSSSADSVTARERGFGLIQGGK